jgi:hypothetical protein
MKTKIRAFIAFLLFTTIFLFQNCSSVSSVKPLPTDDSPMLREFPSFMSGDFEFVPAKEGDTDNNFGDLHLKFAITDNYKLAVTQYYTFDEALLKEHAKYYQVQGDLLVFKNDSLSNLKKQLEDKKSNNNSLSRFEANQLEDLKELEDDGEIFKTYPITKKHGKYAYNEQLVYNIDLKTNQMTMYYENNAPNEKKCVFKKYEDYYFFNAFDQKYKKWTTGILKKQGEDIAVSAIDFDNLQNNSDFYRSVANLIEVKQYNILIDPSASQFKSLMDDANFLEEFAVLKRVDSGFAITNYLWYILVSVAFIIFGFVTYNKRKKAAS